MQRCPILVRGVLWSRDSYAPAAVLKNCKDLAAHSSQRKALARSRPAVASELRNSGDVNSRANAVCNSLWLRGSTRSAAFPATSGREETFEVITGTPAAIAWATGNPKPSYSDG